MGNLRSEQLLGGHKLPGHLHGNMAGTQDTQSGPKPTR